MSALRVAWVCTCSDGSLDFELRFEPPFLEVDFEDL
jgi:hypothetical protein